MGEGDQRIVYYSGMIFIIMNLYLDIGQSLLRDVDILFANLGLEGCGGCIAREPEFIGIVGNNGYGASALDGYAIPIDIRHCERTIFDLNFREGD